MPACSSFSLTFKKYGINKEVISQRYVDLTRFQRIYKLKDEMVGSYDPIDEIAAAKKPENP